MSKIKLKSGIYMIKNLINEKVYIGSAINYKSRWSGHKYDLNLNKHHSIKLQRAWNMYGERNFKFILIQLCTIEDLQTNPLTGVIDIEQYWIDFYDSYKKGYNCNPKAGSRLGSVGSNLGKKFSDETKFKMSIAAKKRIFTAKHKKNISKSLIGNKRNVGKKASPETKIKLSESHKGHKVTEETKRKISQTLKNRNKNKNK